MYCTCYSCQISMKLKLSPQIFEKYSDIKFHKNPSSGSRIGPCGPTNIRADGDTDMTKLPVAFLNFAKAVNKLVIPELPLQSMLLGPTGISLFNSRPL